jgi:integrase
VITLELDYIKKYYTQHHKQVYLFRPPKSVRAALGLTRLPGKPGSKEFTTAYWEAHERMEAALSGMIGEKRVKPGSMAALIAIYYASTAFTTLSEKAKYTYKAVIEPIRKEHGDKPVAVLTREHIEGMMAKKIATPATANLWLRQMRMLMKLAIVKKIRRDDPTAGVAKIEYDESGHHTWTEDEIAAFEERFPVGSKPRLALALLLYIGCRRGDVVDLGPNNLRRGADGRLWLTYTQKKNASRKPVTLTIPIHSELRRIIETTTVAGLKTFLVNENGAPFATGASFGNWMRRHCTAAGLSECSPHGLRKAICRRLAEAGMSPHEIMAITGHKTLKEIERYCAEARQKLLADQAMAGLDAYPARGALRLIEGSKADTGTA